jgi:hypothetical protein
VTSFGGLFGPSNALGSVSDLFSLSNWMQNILGLVVVLVLLFLTCCVIGYRWAPRAPRRRRGASA